MTDKKILFLVKATFLGMPLILLMIIYCSTDPFKVIGTYSFSNYYNWQHWEINRELAGLSNLKERLAKSDTPDSYIFGNSRSLTFRCQNWKIFLDSTSKPYHFDAASESLFGVYHKVKFLEEHHIAIKNSLLVCDATLLAKTVNDADVTHIKHPDISGESPFNYQTNFIKGYFTNFFFLKQIDYMLFGKVRNYMTDIFAINPGYIRTEPYYNDYFYQKYDSMLKTDSAGYYVFKKDVFYKRPEEVQQSEAVLKEKQLDMIRYIKKVFDKQGTHFKLVISPLYDQKKINPNDLAALKEIFGAQVVYDFSGKNEITSTESHYYESSHFKPYIANKIMAEIYSDL